MVAGVCCKEEVWEGEVWEKGEGGRGRGSGEEFLQGAVSVALREERD